MFQKVMACASCLSVLFLVGCNNAPSTSTGSTTTGGSSTSEPGKATGGELTIAVIPKGTTHSFWKSVQAGAETAGKELDAKIIWKGPLKEDDRAAQIQVVQRFTADNVSGIVLAPLDDTALEPSVAAATGKKIPVVIIDSALKGEAGKDFVSLVATDNQKGGFLGGERLAKLLNGKGKVVLLRYAAGSASTMAREAGFLEAMKKNPGITVISDKNYSGATQGEAQTKAMQMIDTLKQADGIFCPNESSTLGMLQALKQNNLAGKVKFVGFDASPAEVEALKADQIQALIAQNPTKMGYEGVTAVVKKIRGETVPTSVDTGVTVIDKENLQTPDVQKLVAP